MDSQLSVRTIKKYNERSVTTFGNKQAFVDLLLHAHGYFLSDVRLEIPSPTTAIFKTKLNAPEGKPVWARAWLSTEEGALGEGGVTANGGGR